MAMMGRKNAVLIGTLISALTMVGLGITAYVPRDKPRMFIIANVVMRLIQGYGDSLTWTSCMSITNIIYSEDKAEKIAYVEMAVGFGTMAGPVIGAFIYSAIGY